MPPSRPTTCSGIVALFDPVLSFSVSPAPRTDRPPPASQTVTVTASPTPMTGSAETGGRRTGPRRLPDPPAPEGLDAGRRDVDDQIPLGLVRADLLGRDFVCARTGIRQRGAARERQEGDRADRARQTPTSCSPHERPHYDDSVYQARRFLATSPAPEAPRGNQVLPKCDFTKGSRLSLTKRYLVMRAAVSNVKRHRE